MFDGGKYNEKREMKENSYLNAFSNDNLSGVMKQSEWSVYDTHFNYIMNRLSKDAKSVQLRREMQNEDNTRSQIEQYFNAITKNRKVQSKVNSISEWSCYKKGIQKVEHLFFWNEYTFRFFGLLVNMCEQNRNSF